MFELELLRRVLYVDPPRTLMHNDRLSQSDPHTVEATWKKANVLTDDPNKCFLTGPEKGYNVSIGCLLVL